MSNVETKPLELRCGAAVDGERPAGAARVDVLTARDVPLGGPRAMTVRRTLPQRARTLIGAWCFADHYGPDDVSVTGGMDVAPHPHTGLQTVSWLFSGEIEHRDSLGSHAFVRPGELNLMTGGYGICHTEVSTPRTTVLHGVQLWVALPEEHRDAERDFQHYAPETVRIDGAVIRVFLGSLAGHVSPVRTFTPLL
ncbi:pirin family protein, partial [Streptomyces bluensis]